MPEARSVRSCVQSRVRLYSPAQVMWAVFLGGPLAFAVFLHANFLQLDNPRLARGMLFGGFSLAVAYWGVLTLLPAGFPAWLVFLSVVMLARHIARRQQPPRVATAGWRFQPHWKAALLILLCIAVSALALAGVLDLLCSIGVVSQA